MKYLMFSVSFLISTQVSAAHLILSGMQDGARRGERNCGQIGIVSVNDVNRASVISKDGNCICNLERELSISDTMELIRNDDRLALICEASFDSVQDVGRPAEIMLAPTVSMTAKNYRLVGRAR